MSPQTHPIAARRPPVLVDASPIDHGDDRRPAEPLAVAPLTDGSRAHVLAHLLRLSDDDRRMRFLRCMPDAAVAAHVAALDFEDDDAVRLGIHDRFGSLVAMVEGFVLRSAVSMEVAFSTDPAWRRLGLAKSLEEAIAAVARRRGIERIVASCSSRNAPMKAFMARCDAATERDADEVNATWPPRRRDSCEAGGLSFDRYVRVGDEQTAQRLFATLPLGAAFAERLVPALATGLLVATIESACIAEMQSGLAAGETVVGVQVEVRHLGPALPGEGLRIRGTGRWCEGRRADFEITVDDGHGRVATARVVLAVVAAARFVAGLARRQERTALLAA